MAWMGQGGWWGEGHLCIKNVNGVHKNTCQTLIPNWSHLKNKILYQALIQACCLVGQ